MLDQSFDLPQLRHAVSDGMCSIGDFEPGAFQITERLLIKAGEACGIHFCLHGPRNVKISAVADLNKRQLLYYGTDGHRVQQQQIPAYCCID